MESKIFYTRIPSVPDRQGSARSAEGNVTVRVFTVSDAKGACMTLLEISHDYETSAALLRKRLNSQVASRISAINSARLPQPGRFIMQNAMILKKN